MYKELRDLVYTTEREVINKKIAEEVTIIVVVAGKT